MNELQISTIILEPAKVEFNKEQVVNELKAILKKYDNLVFTEENTTDIRKTLAELRKGRKTADDYRKDIKKQLTAPVTAFEKEMKEITSLFDEVINPINEQLQAYEERRKEEKRQEVQAFIDEVIEKLQLEQKFASQLVVENEFLNKSASMNQTKESIEFKANNLLNEQKLEIMNKENIESYVKLQNAENSLNLSVVSYLSQLEFKDVESVKNTIDEDVQKALDERMVKEVAKQNEERRKEQEATNLKQQEVVEKEPANTPVFDDLPFGDISVPEEQSFLEIYHVTGTMDEQNKLVKFMEDNGIDYKMGRELPF